MTTNTQKKCKDCKSKKETIKFLHQVIKDCEKTYKQKLKEQETELKQKFKDVFNNWLDGTYLSNNQNDDITIRERMRSNFFDLYFEEALNNQSYSDIRVSNNKTPQTSNDGTVQVGEEDRGSNSNLCECEHSKYHHYRKDYKSKIEGCFFDEDCKCKKFKPKHEAKNQDD